MRRREDFEPDEEGIALDEGSARDGAPLGPRTTTSGIRPRQILIGVLALLLIVFAIANFNPVEVNFLLFETRARVITVIAVAGVLGFVIGYLVGRPTRAERKLLRRRDED